MSWFSRKKSGSSGTPPNPPADPLPSNASVARKPSRADIQAQAMEKVRQARAAIGPEALDKIAAAMQKKQASDLERAKDRIKALDKAHLASKLKEMMGDKDKT